MKHDQKPGKLGDVYEFSRQYMEEHTQNPYHNFNHALDVLSAAKKLAMREGVDPHDQQLLMAAALLHDIVNVNANPYNEEISAGMGRYVMRKAGYDDADRQVVSGLILATKMPTAPKGKLQEIMCDADVWHLQDPDFMEKGELLRQEWNRPDCRTWYLEQSEFLAAHEYYTPFAKTYGEVGLEHNKHRLENILEVMEE